MTYIKICGTLHPATITGRVHDENWDRRESKAITLEMDYEVAKKMFVDGLAWSIVQEHEIETENGVEIQQTEYDNSAFNLAGDITDHRDGRVTIKMGKLTDLEEAYELMLGGM